MNSQQSPIQPARNSAEVNEVEQLKIMVEVNPLKSINLYIINKIGEEITSQIEFDTPPQIIFNNSRFLGRNLTRPQAELDPKYSKRGVPTEILKLLNGDTKNWGKVKALPFSRGDVSTDGTRGLKTIIPDLMPDCIICFSGIGIVRAKANQYGGPDYKDPAFIIDAPDIQTPVYKIIPLGSMSVDSTGNMWSKKNNSPFGAYSYKGLRRKVTQTEVIGNEYGPKIIATGPYSNKEIGWLAYQLPDDVLTPVELLQLDLQLPKEYLGKVYGNIVYAMFSQLRKLHFDRGVVHYQLHPGNWYGRFDENGLAHCIFTDWGTATFITNLPKSNEFLDDERFSRMEHMETQFSELAPPQKAKGIDLFNALSACTLIESPNFKDGTTEESRNKMSLELGNLWVTADSVKYQMLMIAYAIAGYTNSKATLIYLSNMASKFFERYKQLAFEIAERGGMYHGNDFDVLLSEDRSEFVMSIASNRLLQEIAIEYAKIDKPE